MWVNEPPGDSQKVWHEFIGEHFYRKTILDIGAGGAESKDRLSVGENTVTTHDINRALMDRVDLICELDKIEGTFDVVTAFDVIEHVVNCIRFMDQLFTLATERVFITTPNRFVMPRNWHYFPKEFYGIVKWNDNLKYFLRFKGSNFDNIIEVNKEDFLINKDAWGLGLMISKDKE